ncbi:hypothetical protein AXG93_154s1680 [Marchantia polymorpha subsp. ruderalis]|uniref:Uncharacterized protein n=1 Tax=Marchantia polymorpha subsp. ruderalis TaxID=1480154 RepID=A0A176VIF6_MARPO|nr:hypothetical protein AXG93_154s1680 [Marchantia polymorpha subsp. ruderalis]
MNFRVAVLHGFRRVFAHVAPVFLERGIADVETKEMSSLSVEPFPGESIVVTVFEIAEHEVPLFIEREHEFRFLAVTVHTLEGDVSAPKACKLQSHSENIKPVFSECSGCSVLAAKNLSQAAYESFLDHTYLGDRTTTIRQHLASNERIMQEEPPLALRERYGG